MFRIKKNSHGEGEATTEAERPEPEEVPSAKAPPRRTAPMPARPPGGPGLPVDIGRRVPELPARGEAPAAAAREKALAIGKGVHLKGEVLACDRMAIEGDAEITLAGCKHLQIGHSGRFRGTADVSDAEIAGHFDGDLVVRERLSVRPTGRIKGTLRYGQIVIEAGGQVTGDIASLDAPSAPPGEGAVVIPQEGEPAAAASAGTEYVAPVRS
jgi:cytoskeletal protein CcmA (bactofilin family)